MEFNIFTSGYFNRELNFCIENLPSNNIKDIPYSILLTEKILLRVLHKLVNCLIWVLERLRCCKFVYTN